MRHLFRRPSTLAPVHADMTFWHRRGVNLILDPKNALDLLGGGRSSSRRLYSRVHVRRVLGEDLVNRSLRLRLGLERAELLVWLHSSALRRHLDRRTLRHGLLAGRRDGRDASFLGGS